MDSTCNFCEYQFDFALVIKKALYEKYSSSQNYTYIRTINDLIYARRSRATNTFKDYLFWDHRDEYLEDYFDDSKMMQQLLQSHSRKFLPRIFHTPIARTMEYYYHPKLRFSRKCPNNVHSLSVSKILKSSLIQLPQNSSQGSIFFIKNQLNDIVTHSSISFSQIQNSIVYKQEVGVQLRVIFKRFCERRQEIKKLSNKKKRNANSIDRETQTAGFQYIPVIFDKDKQFLQKIIRQQKDKEQQIKKVIKNNRTRNSVEIHNYRYASASKTSQQSTARIQESNMSSRYNSTQQKMRSQRTKSQTQDSNNITKALESQFNNHVDVRQTFKRMDSKMDSNKKSRKLK